MQVCQARIANVEVPNNKCIRYSLQYIYGVGDATAQKVLSATDIDPTKRTYQLAEEEIASIRDELENYTTEGDLRRIRNMNIKRCAPIALSHAHCSCKAPSRLPVVKDETGDWTLALACTFAQHLSASARLSLAPAQQHSSWLTVKAN